MCMCVLKYNISFAHFNLYRIFVVFDYRHFDNIQITDNNFNEVEPIQIN